MNSLRSLLLPSLLLTAPLMAQEPVKLTLRTLAAQMKYDLAELTVAPGAKVTLLFDNPDDMPHNVVFCKPGTNVEQLVLKMLEKPEEAMKRNFLPDDPKVWLMSRLVNPHEKQELEFTAPMEPGTYPYVCTFPGHALSMRGNLRVLSEGPKLKDLKFSLYNGSWTKLPNFGELKPHREGAVENNLIALNFDDYKNQYALVFTGKLEAPEAGEYTFSMAGDDGVRVLIDGEKVVEEDGIHPAKIVEGKKKLKAGEHTMRVEYFQAAGGAELYVGWKGPKFDTTALSKWTPPNYKKSPAQKVNEFVGMPLEVKGEPVIYRNFIAGSGNRAIAVGFPGGLNLSWSAESFNLALAWHGAFIDAARHWKNRGGGYQPPAGFDVLRPTDLVAPLAVLEGPDKPWPTYSAGEVPAGYAWKGYTLDPAGVPTFRYTWNSVEVEDRVAAKGDFKTPGAQLVRTLKLNGKIPENGYLLLARNVTVKAVGAGFAIKGEKFSLEGVAYENEFFLQADGAKIVGNQLLIPARKEIQITYAWPDAAGATPRSAQ